jgi:hypothetical protein
MRVSNVLLSLFFTIAPCVQETVDLESKNPEKRKLAEMLTHTSISLLNHMVENINGWTSQAELDELYESVEEFVQENRKEMDVAFSPFFTKLTSKVEKYADLKTNTLQILARFFRFTMMLKKKYGAELVCKSGSLLLELTFSSMEGYKLYIQDFEKGEIEKQIHSVLLYPPYLANFHLGTEDLTIHLNHTNTRK